MFQTFRRRLLLYFFAKKNLVGMRCKENLLLASGIFCCKLLHRLPCSISMSSIMTVCPLLSVVSPPTSTATIRLCWAGERYVAYLKLPAFHSWGRARETACPASSYPSCTTVPWPGHKTPRSWGLPQRQTDPRRQWCRRDRWSGLECTSATTIKHISRVSVFKSVFIYSALSVSDTNHL